MATQPDTARRNYGCPECGAPIERKFPKGRFPTFCSKACKKAMESRKLADGYALVVLAKAWRLSRNNPADRQLGADCLSTLSAILDLQNERDRKEGRTSAMTMGYAEKLIRADAKGNYLDRMRVAKRPE